MRVLAGDIGGTKVLLQICEFELNGYRVLAEQRFESAAYDGLLPLVQEFLRGAGQVELHGAFSDLVLKPVVVGRPQDELQSDFLELLCIPVEAGLGADSSQRRIEMDEKRLLSLRDEPVTIARFGQELSRMRHRLTLSASVAPVIDIWIDAFLAAAVPEDAGRDRPVRRETPAVLEIEMDSS